MSVRARSGRGGGRTGEEAFSLSGNRPLVESFDVVRELDVETIEEIRRRGDDAAQKRDGGLARGGAEDAEGVQGVCGRRGENFISEFARALGCVDEFLKHLATSHCSMR